MNLDPTKCKISLGNGALAGKLKSLKGSFSKGLSGISAAVGGVLGSLEKALSPKAFQSFGAEFLKLDRLNSGAMVEFKAKWGKAVDGLDGIFEKIEEFDICSILEKGDVKLDADGEKVTTAPPLAVPDAVPPVIPPAPAPATPRFAKEYRSAVAAKLDITFANAVGMKAYWEQVQNELLSLLKYVKEGIGVRKLIFEEELAKMPEAYKSYLREVKSGLDGDKIKGEILEVKDLIQEYERLQHNARAVIKLKTEWADQIERRLSVVRNPELLYKTDAKMSPDYFGLAARSAVLQKITPQAGALIGDPAHGVSLLEKDYASIRSRNAHGGDELWPIRDFWLGWLIGQGSSKATDKALSEPGDK